MIATPLRSKTYGYNKKLVGQLRHCHLIDFTLSIFSTSCVCSTQDKWYLSE